MPCIHWQSRKSTTKIIRRLFCCVISESAYIFIFCSMNTWYAVQLQLFWKQTQLWSKNSVHQRKTANDIKKKLNDFNNPKNVELGCNWWLFNAHNIHLVYPLHTASYCMHTIIDVRISSYHYCNCHFWINIFA